MKNIYFIVSHLLIGGIEIITVNLANALAKRGYNVKIISLLYESELSDMIDNRVEIITVSKLKKGTSVLYKILWRIALLKLLNILKRVHNSIIISTNDDYNIILSKFGNKDCLKIGQLHHDYIGRKSLIKHFKYKYSNLDYFVILTDDIRCEISELMSHTNNHTICVTIPNFQPKRLSMPNNTSPISIIEPYCIAVGRLSPEKGFDRLINVWKILAEKKVNIPHLYIAGNGPEKERLYKLIFDYNLSSHIDLLGSVPNNSLQDLIKNSLCLCMSSHTEAFPIVLLEALTNGTPQVAFDVRVGPRNLIVNGETGFLVSNGNMEEYANRISEICSDASLRDDLSRKSLLRALHFSEDVILEKWEKIFQQYFSYSR